MLGYFSFYQIAPFKAPFFFSANLSIRCFRRGKQYTVQKPITRSLNNNFTLESTPSRIFLVSFDIFFFLLSCSALANYNMPGFIYSFFHFIYEGTEICLNFKFREKRGNTYLRAGAKLTT